MSKLYTKTGDAGFTNLYDTRKIPKCAKIFDLLGGLDEISAHLGMVASLTEEKNIKTAGGFCGLCPYLRKIQVILLDIGSYISTENSKKINFTISEEDVKEIENLIDEYQTLAPPLKEFILPGVKQADSAVQICRTVVRKTEKSFWEYLMLLEDSYINPCIPEMQELFEEKKPNLLMIGKYLNRMSDFLFALSRVVSEGKEITRSQATSSFHRPQVKPSAPS